MSRPEPRPVPRLWLAVAILSVVASLMNLALWVYQWFDRPDDGVEVFNWWMQFVLFVLFIAIAIRGFRGYRRDKERMAAAAEGEQ